MAITNMNSDYGSFKAWCLLIVLMFAMILSLIDRMVISLLVIPIQGEMALSDTDMGWILGVAFGLFYSIMGLPLGLMADRYSRIRLIAMGIALWSLMTMMSGLADSFWTLFLSRMGVGVGEAVLAPAAWSLLADVFPPRNQARALSVFQLGALSGTGLGFLLGGWILELATTSSILQIGLFEGMSSWRVVFVLAALPGALLVVLVLQFRDPRKNQAVQAGSLSATGREVFLFLSGQGKVLPWLFFGMGTIILAIYSVISWSPTMIARQFELPSHIIGHQLGMVILASSLFGVLLGGWITDRAVQRENSRIYVTLLLAAAIGVIPGIAGLVLMPSYPLILVSIGFFFTMATLPNGVLVAYIQRVTPGHIRGIVSASYVLTVNLIGYLFGPPGVALISEKLLNNDLGMAIAVIGISLALLAIWVFMRSRHSAAELLQANPDRSADFAPAGS